MSNDKEFLKKDVELKTKKFIDLFKNELEKLYNQMDEFENDIKNDLKKLGRKDLFPDVDFIFDCCTFTEYDKANLKLQKLIEKISK